MEPQPRKTNYYLRNQADSTVRRTGLPKFKTYFKDIRDKYKNYDFDYALKYSLDIADKYHFLKAKCIVQKSTEETAQAKLGKAPTKDTDEEKEMFWILQALILKSLLFHHKMLQKKR